MKKLLPTFNYKLLTNNYLGFTLVELLVVVSIIAILSVVGIAVFGNVQSRARDARRTADLDSISKALETNFTNGTYPVVSNTMFSSGSIPTDPRTNGNYIGVPNSAGSSYNICADLETVGTFTGNQSDRCVKNQQI